MPTGCWWLIRGEGNILDHPMFRIMKKGDEVEGEGRDLEDLEMGDIKEFSLSHKNGSRFIGVPDPFHETDPGDIMAPATRKKKLLPGLEKGYFHWTYLMRLGILY